MLNIDIHPTTSTGFPAARTDAAYFEYQPFDQGSGLTGKYFNRPNQTNAVSWTRTISPTLINEARLTFSLDDVYIPVNTALTGFNRSQFGINYPYLFAGQGHSMARSPRSTCRSFYGLAGGPYPSHSSGPIWTGGGHAPPRSWSNHTFKSGFYFEYSGENDGDQINVSTVPGGASNQNGTFTVHRHPHGIGRHLRYRHGEPGAGAGGQLHGDRTARATIWRG